MKIQTVKNMSSTATETLIVAIGANVKQKQVLNNNRIWRTHYMVNGFTFKSLPELGRHLLNDINEFYIPCEIEFNLQLIIDCKVNGGNGFLIID